MQRVVVQMQPIPVEVGLRRVGAGLRAFVRGPAAHDGGTVANERLGPRWTAALLLHSTLLVRLRVTAPPLRPTGARVRRGTTTNTQTSERPLRRVRAYVYKFVLFLFPAPHVCTHIYVCVCSFFCFDFCTRSFSPFLSPAGTTRAPPRRFLHFTPPPPGFSPPLPRVADECLCCTRVRVRVRSRTGEGKTRVNIIVAGQFLGVTPGSAFRLGRPGNALHSVVVATPPEFLFPGTPHATQQVARPRHPVFYRPLVCV